MHQLSTIYGFVSLKRRFLKWDWARESGALAATLNTGDSAGRVGGLIVHLKITNFKKRGGKKPKTYTPWFIGRGGGGGAEHCKKTDDAVAAVHMIDNAASVPRIQGHMIESQLVWWWVFSRQHGSWRRGGGIHPPWQLLDDRDRFSSQARPHFLSYHLLPPLASPRLCPHLLTIHLQRERQGHNMFRAALSRRPPLPYLWLLLFPHADRHGVNSRCLDARSLMAKLCRGWDRSSPPSFDHRSSTDRVTDGPPSRLDCLFLPPSGEDGRGSKKVSLRRKKK